MPWDHSTGFTTPWDVYWLSKTMNSGKNTRPRCQWETNNPKVCDNWNLAVLLFFKKKKIRQDTYYTVRFLASQQYKKYILGPPISASTGTTVTLVVIIVLLSGTKIPYSCLFFLYSIHFFYNKFVLKQFLTYRKSTVFTSKCVQWGWACCTDGPRPCWLRRKVVSWPLVVGVVSGAACSQTGLRAPSMQSRVQSSRTERFFGVGNFFKHAPSSWIKKSERLCGVRNRYWAFRHQELSAPTVKYLL